MDQSERIRIDDIAAQIALMELVRLALAEICFSPDPEEFNRRARRIEEAAVNSILERRHFQQADDATEHLIKETASAFITKVISSIRHPGDNTG